MQEFTIQCGPLGLRGSDITDLIGICWIDKSISIALVVDSTHIILKKSFRQAFTNIPKHA